MIVVVDSSVLSLLVNPDAKPPLDPESGQPLTLSRERVEKLVSDMDARTDVLVVPTPVLAEVMIRAGAAAPEVLAQLTGRSRIRIAPFDEMAAVELAALTIELATAGDKRGGDDQSWQKVKLDRQILAVGRVAQAATIYTDDGKLIKSARRLGMTAISSWDLPAPDIEDDLFSLAGVSEPSAGDTH